MGRRPLPPILKILAVAVANHDLQWSIHVCNRISMLFVRLYMTLDPFVGNTYD